MFGATTVRVSHLRRMEDLCEDDCTIHSAREEVFPMRNFLVYGDYEDFFIASTLSEEALR